jgi:hypothetical protein
MPKRNAKGRFIKGGGGGGAMTRYRTRTVTKYKTRHVKAKRHHRRRGHGHGIGMKSIVPLALTAAGMSYVLSESQGIASVRSAVNKIPGAKTFGAPAALGVACLAIDKFVKPNKYLKLAGLAGIVLAASRIGDKGSTFQWLGDDGYDLSDDMEDVGDDTEDAGDDD